MTKSDRTKLWLGILGIGIYIGSDLLRTTHGSIGRAIQLILWIVFACVSFPRLRGPVYPSSETTLHLR